MGSHSSDSANGHDLISSRADLTLTWRGTCLSQGASNDSKGTRIIFASPYNNRNKATWDLKAVIRKAEFLLGGQMLGTLLVGPFQEARSTSYWRSC